MADTAAVLADASDGEQIEQIELEDSLVAYCESHADTTPADLLRAFNVRCYLWPRLTDSERDAGTVVPDERVADCSQDELVACLASWIRLREAEAAFRQALAAAERADIPFVLADRNIQVTLRRAWKLSGLWGRSKMLAALLASGFSREELPEEQIESLKQQSILGSMLFSMLIGTRPE